MKLGSIGSVIVPESVVRVAGSFDDGDVGFVGGCGCSLLLLLVVLLIEDRMLRGWTSNEPTCRSPT